jgi:hypothetical protein
MHLINTGITLGFIRDEPTDMGIFVIKELGFWRWDCSK